MPNWNDYRYCLKCMRPLRKIDYNEDARSNGDRTDVTRTCKRCFSLGGLFGHPRLLGIISPTLGAAVILLACAAYLYTLPDQSRTAKATVLLLPFVVAYHLWERSKCKPIYDRWVAEHGPAPDKWPNASRNPDASPPKTVESFCNDHTLGSDSKELSDRSVKEQRRLNIVFGFILMTGLPIALWLYSQLNQIPSDVGLLEQYCYECQKVVQTGVNYDDRGEGYRACAICGNPTWFKLFPILGLCAIGFVIALAGYSAIMGKPKWLQGR